MAAATLRCRKAAKLVFSSDGTCKLRQAKPDKFPECELCPGPLPISAPAQASRPAVASDTAKPASPTHAGIAVGAPGLAGNTDPCLICGQVAPRPHAWLRVRLDAQPTGLGTPHLLAGERWPLCSVACQAQAEDPELTGAVIAYAADALGAR